MPKRRNPFKQHTLFFLAWFFFSLCRIMPLSWARKMGAGLADLAYYAVPRIRKVGRANLDIAYGDTLTDKEKDRILRASTRNLGLVAVEFTYLPRLAPQDIGKHIKIKGREHLDESHGAVAVGAHHGNWEWMLLISILLDMKAAAVARDFDDPRMNNLVNRVRNTSKITLVPKGNAMGALVREIQNGALVGILADQNPRENAVPVTFFGRDTWATIGPALLALRTSAPIHPISMVRQKNGAYLFEFYPAIEVTPTGNTSDDLVVITQKCLDALEIIIRKNPEQWLWFHRRWKKRERLEREWEDRQAKRGQVPAEGKVTP